MVRKQVGLRLLLNDVAAARARHDLRMERVAEVSRVNAYPANGEAQDAPDQFGNARTGYSPLACATHMHNPWQ